MKTKLFKLLTLCLVSNVFSEVTDPSVLLNWIESKKSIIEFGKLNNDSVHRLVFFHDQKAKQNVSSWFSSKAPELLKLDKIVHYHIIFPGGISFLTPRAKVYSKIREEIKQLRLSIHQKLSKELQEIMNMQPEIWFVDDKRQITSKLEMPRHQLGAVLINTKTNSSKVFLDLEANWEKLFSVLQAQSSEN